MVKPKKAILERPTYQHFLLDVQNLLVAAKRQAARSVNVVLTATYWESGRRIFKFEQRGKSRALYGGNYSRPSPL